MNDGLAVARPSSIPDVERGGPSYTRPMFESVIEGADSRLAAPKLLAQAGSSPLQEGDYAPGNSSATMDFSSFNSLTLASIRSRLNSLMGTPWTISHVPAVAAHRERGDQAGLDADSCRPNKDKRCASRLRALVR